MEITRKNTIIFLDWDDTLFPTNWTVKNNINLMNSTDFNSVEQYMTYYHELDRILIKLLLLLVKYGKIIIVTNAMPEWVKSSSLVLPQTCNILKKIKVISARASYQCHSQNMIDWKKLAFKNIIANEMKKHKFINVISVGDAEYERHALISLNGWNSEIAKNLKVVKFIKEPSHHVLMDQLETLYVAFPEIASKHGHMDLKFRPK